MLLLASEPFKTVKPESLKRCFIQWAKIMLPEKLSGLTLSLDGKTIRSTWQMNSYETPLHIVSAQISELGITLAQKSVDGKSNEIPAVQDLLKELETSGCMVVADALNCQKKTAQAVITGDADYLFSVKDNQETLKKDIEDYMQDPVLQKTMAAASTTEKNRGRIEKRTAFVTNDPNWLPGIGALDGLTCIGAVVHTEFEEKGNQTSEWHYYISSRDLNAGQLLHHARMEWAVETVHWLLDIHFQEDFCHVEDRNVQQNLNMLRKLAINLFNQYKEKSAPKRPISKIMFECYSILPLFVALFSKIDFRAFKLFLIRV